MNIRLFPDRFLQQDACFQLYKQERDGALELPVAIEGKSGIPIHIVHSDPDHLACLAALIVLQSWLYGIDELEIPPARRKPLLIMTDSPGHFADAYLRLHVPAESMRQLSKRRIAALAKNNQYRNKKDKSEFWWLYITPDETRTRLHNFFPADYILRHEGPTHPIASREHVGRGDTSGPAVLICRATQNNALPGLRELFSPFLVIVDAHGITVPDSGSETPQVVYHGSIFAPELANGDDGLVLCCLPDARFERFCSEVNLHLVEPQEPEELTAACSEVDGALHALTEKMDERRSRVLAEVYRAASRLRNILFSLPVGIETYEQSLIASGLPESIWYPWSITEPIQALENRFPEVGSVGEWEEFVVSELVSGFRKFQQILKTYSPKQEPVLAAATDSLGRSRKVALVVKGQAFAEGLRWAVRFPPPFGLGLSPDQITAITPDDIGRLEKERDCIVHHAFDPHDVFSALARAEARKVTFVLLRNELRFLGERFLRVRKMLPNHPAHNTILSPIYRQVEHVTPPKSVTRKARTSTLATDGEFQVLMRLFEESMPAIDYGTVLLEEDDGDEADVRTEVPACLVRLEGDNVVLLEVSSRVTCIRGDDSITSARADSLEPGDRLIIMSPETREYIASRILSAKREEEKESPARRIIRQWQEELARKMEELGISQTEVLRRIRSLGSERATPGVIRQWANGEVLGPRDPHDIRRVGEAIESVWLRDNCQRVWQALFVIRNGHRALGRKITQIIQKAALGNHDLATKDEEYLSQLGVTMGKLQDAVTVLTVEQVTPDAGLVSMDRIGRVIPA